MRALDPLETIVALSSAPGPAARAVVRLSGPAALSCVQSLFQADQLVTADKRRRYHGHIRLRGLSSPLPIELYVWPGPRSYTGQELVELHVVSCPPLIELLLSELLNAGARAAQPGEFTLRAFLAGKLDLPRAEAVLGVIEARDRQELKDALAQLAGGMSTPLQRFREDLLNVLADLEAGFDFTEEDIHFVAEEELLGMLAKGIAQLVNLQRQLDQRAAADRPFRVVLAGPPNAGKSTLFNALLGRAGALVSPEPGTTRDYLVQRLELDGVTVELVDTAGRQTATDLIEKQSQRLGQDQAAQGDLVLLCLEAGTPERETTRTYQGRPDVVTIATKCDLQRNQATALSTSAVSGAGLSELRSSIRERAHARRAAPLVPSLSRCRHHVEACLRHLRQAHDLALNHEPTELLALDLRAALDEIGEMTGAVYSEELLDRVFSRFCIGK
jgi:tRNA modification GTPase